MSQHQFIDKFREDLKYPSRLVGESDKAFKKRTNIAIRQVKADGLGKFHSLTTKFLAPLGLQTEHVLRPKNPDLIQHYACNTVAHMRLIGNGPRRSYENPSSNRVLGLSYNRDGYKRPHELYCAERFNLKPCLLLHAYIPSFWVKDKRSNEYLQITTIKQALELGYTAELNQKLAELEQNRSSGCFTKLDFMHYRFWFFDLDFTTPVAFEQVCELLESVGLFKFLAGVVETSPGKYHLYFHSEMIAGTNHVKNWKPAVHTPYDTLIYDRVFLDGIAGRSHRGMEWSQVANRGMLNVDQAQAANPWLGNDAYLAAFKKHWGVLNRFLGGDPCVHNETRIAQLPFYTNPKTGTTAELLHINPTAPVMTVADVNQAVPLMIERFNKYGAFNPSSHNYKKAPAPTPQVYLTKIPVEGGDKEVEIKPADLEIPIIKDRKPLPATPNQYAQENGLKDEIKWVKDLAGISNEMLKLLAKFAWRYIDLNNPDQRKTFYQLVVVPFFVGKVSNDISRSNFKERCWVRFESLCRANLPYNGKPWRFKKPESPPLTKEWILEKAKSRLPEKLFTTHEKLIRVVADTIVENGIQPVEAVEKNGDLVFNFFVPSKVLKKTVYQYAKKLQDLENHKVLTRSREYWMPVKGIRSNAGAPKTGARLCKEWALVIPKEIAEPVKVEEVVVEEVEEVVVVEVEEVEEVVVVEPVTKPLEYTTDPFARVSSPEITELTTKLETNRAKAKDMEKWLMKGWQKKYDTPWVYLRREVSQLKQKAKLAGENFLDFVLINEPEKFGFVEQSLTLDELEKEKIQIEKELHMAKVLAKNAKPPPPKPDTPDWSDLARQLKMVGRDII